MNLSSSQSSPRISAGPEQSMKIDDRKTNRSIDDNRLIIVNWHRLASANR